MDDAGRGDYARVLPPAIPFLDSYDEIEFDSVSWSRFVYKASRGSDKATKWLRRACSAVVAGEHGPQALDDPSVEFDRLLAAPLPDSLPFATWQDLEGCLRRSGYLSSTFKVPADGGCASRSSYDARWSKLTESDFLLDYSSQHRIDCLVHDAALHCFHHWSRAEFLGALKRVDTNGLAYNSLDAVSAMLFLIVAWSGHPVWERLIQAGWWHQ
jgi:hypothetical protein